MSNIINTLEQLHKLPNTRRYEYMDICFEDGSVHMTKMLFRVEDDTIHLDRSLHEKLPEGTIKWKDDVTFPFRLGRHRCFIIVNDNDGHILRTLEKDVK